MIRAALAIDLPPQPPPLVIETANGLRLWCTEHMTMRKRWRRVVLLHPRRDATTEDVEFVARLFAHEATGPLEVRAYRGQMRAARLEVLVPLRLVARASGRW